MQAEVITEWSGRPILVEGQTLTQLPGDLFIPPDALEILLDSFTGPLDLLLYLIRKQNIDILNIPIVSITNQYLHYITIMKAKNLELASDYLVMAAMLAEIKSRLLLPKIVTEEGEEIDPRAELVKRLQEYEQIRDAALRLDQLPRWERDVYCTAVDPGELETVKQHPDVDLQDLVLAFMDILGREKKLAHHQIRRERLSVREKMTHILLRLREKTFIEFKELFITEEGREGLLVNFLAILELARQSLLTITQTEAFAPIYLQAVSDG